MRAKEFILNEAPLADYQPIGDFNKQGSFRHPEDKKLVQHPVQIEKAYKFFQKTHEDIVILPANIPGASKFTEYGAMTPEDVTKNFGKYADEILKRHNDDGITIVYVSDSGAARVPLTPWIMAHRFGHAIQASTRRNSNGSIGYTWKNMEEGLIKPITELMGCYRIWGDQVRNSGSSYYDDTKFNRQYPSNSITGSQSKAYAALFNAIGTMRSARTGKIDRPYEFIYEMFTQWLNSGEVRFNPIPQSLNFGQQAWGKARAGLNLRNPEEAQDLLDQIASDASIYFSDVMSACIGKIFVM
jgi:hypothetical protein